MKKLSQMFYLAKWFFGARFLGRKNPLQTVLFITDKCNLACKHCSVYSREKPHTMTYAEVRDELEYAYGLGSRFVDFEGGEVMLWRDGDFRINDLLDLAREVGFFSATITTNAQLPFAGVRADSIWVSLDGYGKYHETIRGEGTFARLEKNIAACGHPHLSVNMVVNKYNWESVADTIRYVRENPAIESISINFYTPFPDAENLMITQAQREAVIDTVIAMKRQGYPIMNSVSGLPVDEAQPVQAALLGDQLYLCRPQAGPLRRCGTWYLRRLRALHGRRDECRLQPAARYRAGRPETAVVRRPSGVV